jgi:hypothetical protein
MVRYRLVYVSIKTRSTVKSTLGTKLQLKELKREVDKSYDKFEESANDFINLIHSDNPETVKVAQIARLRAVELGSILQDKILDLLGGDFGT